MRALVERHSERPFRLLTIDTNDPAEGFVERCAEAGMTWPVIHQGEASALSRTWGVMFYPTVFVLDAKGVIRFVNPKGDALDQAIEQLLGEV